jgi:hypothetical protein
MNNEIKHYGVLGMKWGFRRYQNADGTLTSAGKRRAKRLRDQYNQLTGKRLKDLKINNNDDYKKTFVKLNDKQLQNRINRLSKEKQMKDLERDLKRETQTPGAKLRGKILNQVVLPAAAEAGKNALKGYLEKQFKKALGVESKGKGNNKKKNNSGHTIKDDFTKEVNNFSNDIKKSFNNAKSDLGSEKKERQNLAKGFVNKVASKISNKTVNKKDVQTGEVTMQEIWKEFYPDLVD